MSSSETVAPIAWLNARMALEVMTSSRTLIIDDFVAALLLAAIANTNTSYLDARPDMSQRYRAAGSVTDDMRRPARVSSLARSLGIPRETARGKAMELVRAGLVQAGPDGLILRSDALMSEPGRKVTEAFLGSIRNLVEGLGRLGVLGLDETWRLAEPDDSISWGAARLMTAGLLRSVAHVTQLTPDLAPLSIYVLLAVTQETGAELTLDAEFRPVPALGSPPVGPVRGATIASRLALPPETVRRHLHRLVETDRLTVGPAGYSVRITEARLPIWRDHQALSVTNVSQLVWRMKAAGIISQG